MPYRHIREMGAVSSAPCSVCGAFEPWQASPLGRSRMGWGVEALIIEQGAADAVRLLPMLGRERRDYLVRLVDQPSPIDG
jgi:hypothetical protein